MNTRKRIQVNGLNKTFVLHHQNGARIPVLDNIDFTAREGECVVLAGQSGSGKSTLLRSLYGNYLPDRGEILVYTSQGEVDIAKAHPRQIQAIRTGTIGWVSQFLRVIPRVSTLEVVMQPLLELGVDPQSCREKAAVLLDYLNIPRSLWNLAPSTFSGGEQQRVNIARGFIVDYPILLLDEPTASLDRSNADAVVTLIEQAKSRGAAVVGIFHDEAVRDRVADRLHHINPIREKAA